MSGVDVTGADEQVLTAELAVLQLFCMAFAVGRLKVQVLQLRPCCCGGSVAGPLRSHGHLPQPVSLKPERVLALE